jgi:hypothetical protein
MLSLTPPRHTSTLRTADDWSRRKAPVADAALEASIGRIAVLPCRSFVDPLPAGDLQLQQIPGIVSWTLGPRWDCPPRSETPDIEPVKERGVDHPDRAYRRTIVLKQRWKQRLTAIVAQNVAHEKGPHRW